MTSIVALRQRLPLIVFLFLLLLVLMLVGIACLCLTDHPMQAIERVVSALAQVPAVSIVWVFLLAGTLPLSLRRSAQQAEIGRASPAALQRFLF